MQNHHQDALFDNNKYYFPPDTIVAQKQPLADRDDAGLHDAHKYADVTPGGLRNGASSQGTRAVHSIGLQQLASPQLRIQSQPPQYEGPEPNASQTYGQSSQTLPLSQISSYYNGNNPTYDPQPIPSNTKDQQLGSHAPTNPCSSWVSKDIKVKRWIIWAISGALILIIGVGAIIGGIIGARAEKAKHAPVGNPSNIPTVSNTTSSNTPQTTSTPSVRLGSRLAVTGYRNATDYSIRLFYQDEDNQLQFIDKEGASVNWSKPTVLNLPYEPIENGTITAGSDVLDDDVPKIVFFYEDKDGIIRGQNFNFEFENGSIPVNGEPGSINTYPLQIAGNSRISSYFPYLVSQDADNSIRWSTMIGQNGSDDSAPWWVNSTGWNGNVKASKAGGVVALPIAQNYTNAGGIVYRSNEGMLSVKIHDESAESNAGVSWKKGALSKEIPANSPIGAFAVGRPYDSDNQINTYILYIDNNGLIQMVWQDDDNWQGPETFDVLGSARNGTDIACLTPGSDEAVSAGISKYQDMNRCFYQTSFGIKEVWFDGANWHDEGIVVV
ncbi:uncharacterized protein GGS22DRAFT_151546 [Annulohypoxylon maeteangense]|uniref:uncharacterized protein n=1 Tax=Annulohypoxylon maeteangense TaxID=1927788 RepID=UPI0020079360|nr:uncharacterized protein GGS22DRAFT_151546 [Annulohypoxylon maeteangense]KAI0890672.1 hypothetical protein GGS22DRAFT_151546 [Annulohypoxylon maeteangense]